MKLHSLQFLHMEWIKKWWDGFSLSKENQVKTWSQQKDNSMQPMRAMDQMEAISPFDAMKWLRGIALKEMRSKVFEKETVERTNGHWSVWMSIIVTVGKSKK